MFDLTEIINNLKERRCDFAFFRKEFTDHSLDMLPLLSDEAAAAAGRLLIENRVGILRLEERQTSLEDIFLSLTGGKAASL